MNNEVVRVLVTSPLGVGGVTNMMIHIQEHLDRSKINFDYLVFHDRHEPMEDKVLSLGSKKYVASADNVKFRPFRRIWRILLAQNWVGFNILQYIVTMLALEQQVMEFDL